MELRARLIASIHNGYVTDESDVPEPEQPRGLYSGFERYTTPTDDDYRAVLTNGLVVLDTNALLNLYRYTPRVRSLLLDLLTKAGDTLWEPDQVMLEFWRKREAAIRDYDTAAQSFDKSVTTAKNSTIEAIRALGNRIGLDDDHKNALAGPIEEAYAKLLASVERTMNHDAATAPNRNTGTDPVLAALDPLLRGRVGKALDPEALQVALSEAKRRVAAKEPPGYMDANKPDGGVGDFLVWRQLLHEAESRRSDALFVTGDVKEDWWRKWGGVSSAGPRLELLDEFHSVVGSRLFMLQPGDFLIRAAAIFGIQVPAESVAQVRTIDRSQAVVRGARGAAYEGDVVDAISRVTGSMIEIEIVEPSDPVLSGIDLELHDAGHLIAVVITYGTKRPLNSDWVRGRVDDAISRQYDKLLMIANVDIRDLDYRRLREAGIVSRFAVWRSPEDDEFLGETIRELRAAKTEYDG